MSTFSGNFNYKEQIKFSESPHHNILEHYSVSGHVWIATGKTKLHI